jgi:hypothetical protein
MAILTNWYQFKRIEKLHTKDIFQVSDVSTALKIWVSGPQKPNTKWNLESSVPRARKQVVWLEDELAITTMGSKDCYLSNYTLF